MNNKHQQITVRKLNKSWHTLWEVDVTSGKDSDEGLLQSFRELIDCVSSRFPSTGMNSRTCGNNTS